MRTCDFMMLECFQGPQAPPPIRAADGRVKSARWNFQEGQVPTVAGQLLYVFVVLSLIRWRVLHLNRGRASGELNADGLRTATRPRR